MVGDSLMEEVRSDLDLEKLGSTRSDRKEVGRLPQAVGWQTQAIATGWVGTMMEEWVLKVVSGNIQESCGWSEPTSASQTHIPQQ